MKMATTEMPPLGRPQGTILIKTGNAENEYEIFLVTKSVYILKRTSHFDEFSSLAALEVVISTTFGVVIDENLVKMTPFRCQWTF